MLLLLCNYQCWRRSNPGFEMARSECSKHLCLAVRVDGNQKGSSMDKLIETTVRWFFCHCVKSCSFSCSTLPGFILMNPLRLALVHMIRTWYTNNWSFYPWESQVKIQLSATSMFCRALDFHRMASCLPLRQPRSFSLTACAMAALIDFDRLQDPIACICATEQCLLVARESGVVQRYALPLGTVGFGRKVQARYAAMPLSLQPVEATFGLGMSLHHSLSATGSLTNIGWSWIFLPDPTRSRFSVIPGFVCSS